MRRNTCLTPCVLFRNIYFNFFRSKIKSHKNHGLLYITAYSVLDIKKTAQILLNNSFTIGFKKYKGSRLETSLWMDDDSTLEIGEGGCTVYHGCDIQIFKNAKLYIGGCSINRSAQIICQDEITIGRECLISRDVLIRDNDGGHRICTEGYKKTAPIHIGNHVWIGQGAMIMKGVTIGDGAIIGAGAFVATNVKPNSLVMPDPSRVFKNDIKWEYK